MFSELQLECFSTDNKDFSSGEIVLQPCFQLLSSSHSYSSKSLSAASGSAYEDSLSGIVQHIESMIFWKNEPLLSTLYCFFFLNPSKIFFLFTKVSIYFIFGSFNETATVVKMHLQGWSHLSYLCYKEYVL